VVPAHAGTHTPRPLVVAHRRLPSSNNERPELWVPACAGTTFIGRFGFQKLFNVVPAHAGTHTPRPLVVARRQSASSNNECPGLWVPACAGTTFIGYFGFISTAYAALPQPAARRPRPAPSARSATPRARARSKTDYRPRPDSGRARAP